MKIVWEYFWKVSDTTLENTSFSLAILFNSSVLTVVENVKRQPVAGFHRRAHKTNTRNFRERVMNITTLNVHMESISLLSFVVFNY